MRRRIYAALIVLTALAHGCARPVTSPTDLSDESLQKERRTQIMMSFNQREEREAKLQDISYPLLKVAADICEDDWKRGYGFAYKTLNLVREEWRDVIGEEAGFGDSLNVTHVVPNGPFDRAGIRKGDVLVAFGDITLEGGKPGVNMLEEAIEDIDDEFEDSGDAPPVSVEVSRDGEQLTLEVESDLICSYGVHLAEGGDVNAYADGDDVVIFSGMYRFADEDELALIVAHEIAHNAMGHIDKKIVNSVGGAVLDTLIGLGTGINVGMFQAVAANVYSEEFEAEADYIGLYLVARTGRDVSDAAEIWRKLAAEFGGSIDRPEFASTHPTTPERFLAIEKAVAEIRAKTEAGEELMPNIDG